VERDDLALDGLLSELARAPEGEDAFVRRVLEATRPRRSGRAPLMAAAAGLAAALAILFQPAPAARMGFARQACLVPEATSMRLLAKEGERFLLLGEVPMGAQARVPAETPILLQAVGPDGLALWTARDPIRLRSGEVRAPSAGPVLALERKSAQSVTYARDVKPSLDQHCAGCHAEHDLIAAARPFDARHSGLVTQGHGLLPPADRRQIALWIDLGAARP
jgi:hypothetical protein